MAKFIYKAKKNTAETVTGQINARNQDEAVDLINQLGMLPVSVIPHEDEIKRTKILISGKVKSKEVFIFSRQMANLLRSGVSLLKSLNIIEEQTQNAYFKNVISDIATGIKNGKAFSQCLAEYPKIFSGLYITMVRAGEESGNLREMLLNVAVHQRAQEEVRSKVRTALIYPVFMVFVGFASVYFILTFVVPKMAGLFSNIGTTLPVPTVILLSLSDFLHKAWLWVVLTFVVIVFFLNRWLSSQKGKITSSVFSLKMPLLGAIILKAELARFSRTLVLLLKSGISLVGSIKMSIPVLNNEIIKGEIAKCEKVITAGGSFGDTIKKSKIIPSMMGHLISIGEESGNLNDVLTELAETYEQETTEQMKIITTLLEPMMILLVGLFIGFIVFALLLPIFQVDVFAQ